MKNPLAKDIIRDIKKSKGRFLSILFIVALGVAFFSGIKVSPIVMRNTSDKYYDDYNLMDIRLISTLGLTNKDVDEVKKINGVEGVFPTYSIDVLAKYKAKESTVKIHALPLDDIKDNSKNYINQVKVVEGRLPKKTGECVLEREKIKHLGIPVGAKIKLESGSDDELSDKLKTTEYEVVGLIETPYYLSYDKGSSDIGSGKLDGIMMIPQDDFKIDAYTEMFLTVKGAKDINSYKDEYFDIVDKVSNKIENISVSRIQDRYDEVIGKANKELNKGKKEFEDKKNEVNDKLEKAQQDINNYKAQINEGENTLKNKKSQVESQLLNGKSQIEQGEKELENGYLKYNEGLATFNQNKVLAETGFLEAEKVLKESSDKLNLLKLNILDLEAKLKDENLSKEEKYAIQSELNMKNNIFKVSTSEYEKGKIELDSKKQQIQSAEQELVNTKYMLDNNKQRLEQEKVNLIQMESKAKIELLKAENEIEEQKNKIKEAEIELEKSKSKAEDELSKAEKSIKDSEDEISKIEKPEWYILDRNSHYSYAEYAGCANSIDALAKIFPVFFFSVAALVCLTTMTRMVDEQRINIGTLKALGYTTGQIVNKYIVYALSSSLLGSILGLSIGFTLFPIVVFNSYGIMYTLPPMMFVFDIPLALGVTVTSIAITTLAAYSACYKELKENPSTLMRPRSPKSGKRILLERVPFIWNKISFIGKVTVRNIFRYKKRFLMTVLGISGCTALILTGLGIQDSIQMIVDGQYGSIFKYDMTITIDNNAKVSEIKKIEDIISKDKRISDYQLVNFQNGKVTANNVEKEVTMITPNDINYMDEFIHLKDRKTQKPLNLSKEGIVLSEKVARQLDIKAGDSIELINSKDKKVKVEVVGIAENYVSHYAYISKEYYKKVFNRDIEYNRVIGKIKDTSKQVEENISTDIMKQESIKGVSFNTGAKENFHDTIANLNYVVLIMTVSAGALAFVVLYNLTNVNISERIREIATIKVLGFYDNEVSAYIYRENTILTLIGTIVGLGLGVMLHQFIMITVELESMMFGRVIENSSYIISAILTIALGIIVNFAMYYKLKTVQMVESLKSVD